MPDRPDPAPGPALRQLSEQVARLWMGWHRGEQGWQGPAGEAPVAAEARFAEDPRRAAEALAVARQRGVHCTVRLLPERQGQAFEVVLARGDQRHSTRGRTLPEAVCQALLQLCEAGQATAD